MALSLPNLAIAGYQIVNENEYLYSDQRKVGESDKDSDSGTVYAKAYIRNDQVYVKVGSSSEQVWNQDTVFGVYRGTFTSSNRIVLSANLKGASDDTVTFSPSVGNYTVLLQTLTSSGEKFSFYINDSIQIIEDAVEPQVTSVGPIEAIQGVSTTFTVTGTDLPTTVALALHGSVENSCGSVTYIDSTSAKVNCTPSDLGRVRFYVAKVSKGEAINGSENLHVTVKENIQPPATLYSPVNNATNISDQSQNFDWSNVSDATVYRLVVSDNVSFNGFNDTSTDSSSCTDNDKCKTATPSSSRYSGFNLKSNTLYYWKVRSDVSDWSSVYSFRTEVPVVEPKVTSVSPTSATQGVSTTFTVTGTDLPTTIALALHGSVEGSCGSVTYIDSTSAKVNCTPSDLGRVRFYVAKVSKGEAINGSENLHVTVKENIQPPATLYSPVNNATNISDQSQNFDWSNVSDATVYRLVVSDNVSFNGFNDTSTDSSSCTDNDKCKTATPSSSRYSGFNLKSNTLYYWKVRSDVSDWSSVYSFRTEVPVVEPQVTSVSPIEATQGVSTTFTVTGTDLPTTVALALHGSVENSCGSVTYIDSTSAEVNCTPSDLGRVRFYVAKIADGEPINGSGNLYVTVSEPVDLPPTLFSHSVTPVSGDSGDTFTFETTWNDPENKSVVDVQVRYRKQGASSWSSSVYLSHVSNYTFLSGTAVTGEVGTYEYQVMAKDAMTASGSRVNDTGWLSGGTFVIDLHADGVCGSADGKNYPHDTTGYGSESQCEIGSSSNSAFPSQGKEVDWVCSGLNGGNDSPPCSASREIDYDLLDSLNKQAENLLSDIQSLDQKIEIVENKISEVSDSNDEIERLNNKISEVQKEYVVDSYVGEELKEDDVLGVLANGDKVNTLPNGGKRQVIEEKAVGQYKYKINILHPDESNYPALVNIEYTIDGVGQSDYTKFVYANNYEHLRVVKSHLIGMVVELSQMYTDVKSSDGEHDEVYASYLANSQSRFLAIENSKDEIELAITESTPTPLTFKETVKQAYGEEEPAKQCVSYTHAYKKSFWEFREFPVQTCMLDYQTLTLIKITSTTLYESATHGINTSGKLKDSPLPKSNSYLFGSGFKSGSKYALEEIAKEYLATVKSLSNPQTIINETRAMFSDVYSFIKNPGGKVEQVQNQIAKVFVSVKSIVDELPEAIENIDVEDGGFASGYIGVNVGLEIVDPVKKLGKIVKSLKGGSLVPAWVVKSQIAIERANDDVGELVKKIKNRIANILKSPIFGKRIINSKRVELSVGEKVPGGTLSVSVRDDGQKQLIGKDIDGNEISITVNSPGNCCIITSNSNKYGGTTYKRNDGVELEYDKDGFPVIEPLNANGKKSEVYIDPTATGHDFSNANIALSNQFNDDELRKIGLNDIQINDVRNGKPSSPTGFTWHHHQDVGKMQLIPSSKHKGFPHTGGCSIWSKEASCPIESTY